MSSDSNEEKQRLALEQLAFQKEESEKRFVELNAANKELLYQNNEKAKRTVELTNTNEELAFENNEKEKQTAELTLANKELHTAEDYLKDYVHGLREILFVTSHKVRGPVANILGISAVLEDHIHEPTRLLELISYVRESALSLDAYTKELTQVIIELRERGTNSLPRTIE